MDDFPLREFLLEMGFDTEQARTVALSALAAAGLTRAGKQRMCITKREAAQKVLGAVSRRCENPECIRTLPCNDLLADMALVTRAACPCCQGSDNQRAFRRMVQMTSARNIGRILVVGGAPDVAAELQRLRKRLGGPDLRIVEGNRTVTKREASALTGKVDLAIIWGGTILAHRVSNNFEGPLRGVPTGFCGKGQRGVAALCQSIEATLNLAPERP